MCYARDQKHLAFYVYLDTPPDLQGAELFPLDGEHRASSEVNLIAACPIILEFDKDIQ